MKLMKKTNTYKASNVTFNATTLEAYSYNWWKFVAIVEGKIVFNNFRYSPSTGNHQRKVRNLMQNLGIKIDLFLPLPDGIKSHDSLAEMIEKAEISLCLTFLSSELKKQDRNEMNRIKRAAKKAEQVQTITLVEQQVEA